MFLAGGPVHTAAFGVFTGCLSVAGRRNGTLPRALTTAGFVSAGAGALSPLSVAARPAVVLIPVARISGLAVSGIAGAGLRRSPTRRSGQGASEHRIT
jgi:hypothetical protein